MISFEVRFFQAGKWFLLFVTLLTKEFMETCFLVFTFTFTTEKGKA